MTELRPLHDRVLIKPVEASTKTPAGIIIPDTAKERPQEGLVIAVGSGKILANGERREIDLKAGERVLYGKYSGVTTKMGEDEVILLREEEILAVVLAQ